MPPYHSGQSNSIAGNVRGFFCYPLQKIAPPAYIPTMPKKLSVPIEDIKAYALATSLAEASRHYGLKETTVRSMACRGKWMTPERLKREREKLNKAERETRTLAEGNSPATVGDALEDHLQRSTKVFRTGMATALQRIGETAGEMDGLTALEHSRKLKDASDVAKTILGIGQDSSSASLQVNLLTLSLDNILKPVQSIEI